MDIAIGSDGEIISLDGEEWLSDENSINYKEEFNATLRAIKENDRWTQSLEQHGDAHYIQEMTDGEWEKLGRDIANNTHLQRVELYDRALNDHKTSFLFRELGKSSSIKNLELYRNELSAVGVRSVVPFLQNANNLQILHLGDNNIQSEGFNLLFRALRNSPIEELNCGRCGIESIEIEGEHIPRNLKELYLYENGINSDMCRELVKLLQGSDSKLKLLHLNGNDIDDEGVEIIVEALRSNKALNSLYIQGNRISKQGKIMLLKLVNDISSIEATLQSNHTLANVKFFVPGIIAYSLAVMNDHIQKLVDAACNYNRQCDMQTTNLRESNPGVAGRMKVIQTQLHSERRAELAELQGVNHSAYSEIDPLHLPEVLALVGRRHGQGELYVALKSSIAGVISTVNRKECLKQERGYHHAIIVEHSARVEAIDAEIAAIEAAEGRVVHFGSECNSNKKRRV